MRGAIFWRTLRDRKRSLIGWLIGMGALTLFSVVLYPSIRDSDLSQVVENLPQVMREMFSLDVINTPAGYLNTRQFGLTAPLLIMIFAIGMGSDLTAGEEERHTMDLLLAHPIRRATVVIEKFAALCVGVIAIELVQWLSIVVPGPLAGLDASPSDVGAAVVTQGVMGITFGALALAAGAWSGARGLSRGIATSVAVASYLLSAFAPLADWLEPFRRFSLYFHGQGFEPVLNGWAVDHIAVLFVTGGVCLAVALRLFERRDISV